MRSLDEAKLPYDKLAVSDQSSVGLKVDAGELKGYTLIRTRDLRYSNKDLIAAQLKLVEDLVGRSSLLPSVVHAVCGSECVLVLTLSPLCVVVRSFAARCSASQPKLPLRALALRTARPMLLLTAARGLRRCVCQTDRTWTSRPSEAELNTDCFLRAFPLACCCAGGVLRRAFSRVSFHLSFAV